MPKDNSPSNLSPYHHLTARSTECDILFALWIPLQKPGGLYHDPNDPHLHARRLASQTTYSWTVWIYLETIGTHTCIYITYICYSTHTRAPILKQGPVSRRRDLTPHRLSIRRRCRNFAIFAFCSLQQQRHGRSSGSALACTTDIPISRNRIFTHVYKYLNAFIIHIYIRRGGIFSLAYTSRTVSFARALTNTYTHTQARAFATLMLHSWKEVNFRSVTSVYTVYKECVYVSY